MFPKMRRFKQQISDEECREVLRSQVRGVLSVLGEDGYPYGMPVNFWFDEKTGNFYFHGAKKGHKISAIEKCDKVSLCVYDEGYREEGDWALNIRSVITFGRMHKVTDPDQVRLICQKLTERFPAPEGYADYEIEKVGNFVQCLELVPEHMTGKLVNES